MSVTLSAVDWLLSSDEPGIVAQAKRDLLDEQAPAEAARILDGPKVRTLLAGQQADGGFGIHVYAKWGGAHWRLVSLVELGVPAGEPRCLAAAETVLAWLTGKGHRDRIQVIDGLTRRCGSQEGNALAVCCRLGLADDPRVRLLAESLVEWQWPDGGWNCDKKATRPPLIVQRVAAADVGAARVLGRDRETAAKEAAERTAELFLEHRLFRALATGEPIRDSFVTLHSPPFWHYDFLQALVVLARMGLAATRAPPTRSTCSRSAGSRTAAGAPAAAGGGRRARRAATSRSSIGAPGRASC